MKMRRTLLLVSLVLGLLTFLALASGAGAADPLKVQLRVQNNSGQSGTATLTDNGDGSTKVVLDLQGGPAGPQPAHIHTGTCTQLGPVTYPLTNVMNGKSETTVKVAISALVASPYAVNVHKSPQEASVYTSCGEITQTPGATPRTGGGGMAGQSSPLPWLLAGMLLALTVAGVTIVLRRRAV